MVSARKFVELGAPVTDEIAELSPIETTTRNLTLEFDDPEKVETVERTKPRRFHELGARKHCPSKSSD